MRFSFFALPISLLLCAAPLCAQTRTIVSDDELTPIVSPKISYDALKKSYRIDTKASLASVRADVAGNAGRVIEIIGRVSGIMTTSKGRTVIFDSDSGTAVFVMSLEIPGAELVSAGQTLRTLLLVSSDDGDASWKPLAFATATYTPSNVSTRAVAMAAPSAIIKAPDKPYTDDGVLVTPPGWDASLPEAPPMVSVMPTPQNSNSARNRAQIAPMPLTRSSGEGQAAAYAALARRFNVKLTAAQSNEIGAAIISASRAHNLDARFLASIIAVESDFDIYCLSSSGAMGLGQIMPFNLRPLGISNAWNPTQNIHGSAKMLRQNLNMFGTRSDATLLAVAAYNAGPNAVKRAGNRVPNGSQVQRYVWKVYNQYKAFAPELFAGR
ncbi:MAG TPA: lytic transglycosylase domain-containing protein [Abditibacteriaceae bacterium]|jgi:soluble lytic murein transglycosylase-like protein